MDLETVTSLYTSCMPAFVCHTTSTSLTTHSLPLFSPVVEVDLLAQHFRPGKPNYERLKVALTKNVPLRMDFLLALGEPGCSALLLPHLETAAWTVDPRSGAEACVESLLNASKRVCVETIHTHITKVLCNGLHFLHNGIHIVKNN